LPRHDFSLSSPPATLATAFRGLLTIDDLATLLELRVDQLRHYTYGRGYRYRSFAIRKRSGRGSRDIREPSPGLKIVQLRLAQVLDTVASPRRPAHGFVATRSIATNALQHVGADWVLNVDLADFFPSINFGRVLGLFTRVYRLPPNVSTVLARLCVFDNQLPQGAPTSPVISNMVAWRLDRDLERLASRYRCQYTRYADDMTFSRNGQFPDALGFWDPAAAPRRVSRIGDMLESAIRRNGFQVHPDKVRLSFRDERQLVTGLVVNRRVNVRRTFGRRIRAMLHAWGTYGEAAAEAEFFGRYDTKDRSPHAVLSFRRVVKGHIDFLGMIRGLDDPLYRTLLLKYAALVPGYAVRPAQYRRPNHVRTWKDAIWIIETDETQGTAFELEGYGLVTCAHVVRDVQSRGYPSYANPRVYSPRNEDLEYAARVVSYDADLDLAILEVDGPSSARLPAHKAPLAGVGTPVRGVGFPQHSPAALMWDEVGTITHLRRHMNFPRYMLTNRIVEGASGSPILDMHGRVIAVATVGAPSFAATVAQGADAARTVYGAVPISGLDNLS
jgi:RNA-directed DNA polymerase